MLLHHNFAKLSNLKERANPNPLRMTSGLPGGGGSGLNKTVRTADGRSDEALCAPAKGLPPPRRSAHGLQKDLLIGSVETRHAKRQPRPQEKVIIEVACLVFLVRMQRRAHRGAGFNPSIRVHNCSLHFEIAQLGQNP